MSELQRDDFLKLWIAAESDQRFRYRLNRRLIGFLLVLQVIVWGYFTYTVVQVGLTLELGGFLAIYASLSLLLLGMLMRWRAFCVMSGVVLLDERVVWSERGKVVAVLWCDLETGGVNLDQGKPTDLTSHVELRRRDGRTERMIVTTPFAYLDDVQSLIGGILSKSNEKGASKGRPTGAGSPAGRGGGGRSGRERR